MRQTTEFSVPKDLQKKLRGNSASERLLHRLHSIALVLNGRSASEAARIYGDSPRAVAYWVTRFREKGLKGVEEESRTGRPPRLNPSQMKRLETFVKQSRARSQVINADVLSAYIKEAFGVTFTLRQCWRILRRLAG